MKLYPSVGVKKQAGVHFIANFGQQPFVFDIDGMVKVCFFAGADPLSYTRPRVFDSRSSTNLFYRKRSTPFVPRSV